MNKLFLIIAIFVIIGQQILCIYQMNNADKITPEQLKQTTIERAVKNGRYNFD